MPVRRSCIIANFYFILSVKAYTNVLYTIAEQKEPNSSDLKCEQYKSPIHSSLATLESQAWAVKLTGKTVIGTVKITPATTAVEKDPMDIFEDIISQFLTGSKTEQKEKEKQALAKKAPSEPIPNQYPSGNIMRGELYQNRTGVHLPMPELIHRGHCRLNVTMDFMQTAVNAFSIFLVGDLDDILRLPASYVLHSARTISMMSIAREKLVATWAVVKGDKQTHQVTIETLELYRPLFKYLNGKEISKLNLTDSRILTYIGTHADLTRHQVGVVASKYIKLNHEWSQPKYLNMMNNLLCGVPMTFMRRIPEKSYLQLSHQVFYHIRACDPLQRRFYLGMMTKSQALGKSYSWNARDVSRLGLLLAEVDGSDLSAINPEAMAGISAHVISFMDPQNLLYFTNAQLKFMAHKPLNILTIKIKSQQDQQKVYFSNSIRLRSALIKPLHYYYYYVILCYYMLLTRSLHIIYILI